MGRSILILREYIMITDYKKYIRSNAWRRKRTQYFESKMYNTYPTGKSAGKFVCYVCGSDDNLQLHHRTYKRLGNERINVDLVPVCQKCHTNIHKLQKKKGCDLWKATKQVVRSITNE